MPSLAEEDPEYPEKVKAFLMKRHMRRLPWGFIVAHGQMVGTKGTVERQERAYMGETAIRLLRLLGVTESNLESIDIMADAGLNDEDLLKLLPFTVMQDPPVQLVPAACPAEPPAPSDPVPGT